MNLSIPIFAAPQLWFPASPPASPNASGAGQHIPSVIIRVPTIRGIRGIRFWTQNECIFRARDNHMNQCLCHLWPH